jgi:shikimate kinase
MKHLVLVGLMGSGKTTVGEACAAKLGRPFVDTDDLVVTMAHTPIEQIFATNGEARFRELEELAVADACASTEPLVIGCGGGTVVNAGNRRALQRAGVVIWLRAAVDVLAARVGDGTSRPLLAGDPRGALSRLSAAREAAYEAAADATVDASASVAEVCDAVLDAFEKVSA